MTSGGALGKRSHTLTPLLVEINRWGSFTFWTNCGSLAKSVDDCLYVVGDWCRWRQLDRRLLYLLSLFQLLDRCLWLASHASVCCHGGRALRLVDASSFLADVCGGWLRRLSLHGRHASFLRPRNEVVLGALPSSRQSDHRCADFVLLIRCLWCSVAWCCCALWCRRVLDRSLLGNSACDVVASSRTGGWDRRAYT